MSFTTPTEADGSRKRLVDSGAVECVASRERVPRLRVEETLQSMRGEEIWTCAGEKEIKEEGQKSWSTG